MNIDIRNQFDDNENAQEQDMALESFVDAMAHAFVEAKITMCANPYTPNIGMVYLLSKVEDRAMEIYLAKRAGTAASSEA